LNSPFWNSLILAKMDFTDISWTWH
jgi:hypothetical protein